MRVTTIQTGIATMRRVPVRAFSRFVAGGRLEQRQDLSARPAGGKGGQSLVRGAIDPGAERLRAQTKHVSAGLRLQLGVRFAAVWVGEEEERGAEVTDEIADLRVSLGHRAPRAKGASTPVRR